MQPSVVGGGEPFEAGIDTLKAAGYLADDASYDRLRAAPFGLRVAGGGAYRLTKNGEGSWLELGGDCPAPAVLWYPNTGLLAFEGHPGGAPGVLGAPDAVPAYVGRVRELLAGEGIGLRAPIGITRLDATTGQRYDRPADALAALSALAALEPTGRLKPATYGRPLETVYIVTPKGSKRGRWYLSEKVRPTADLGSLRGEDQRRYDRHSRRPLAESIDTAHARQAFRSRFVTLSKATKGVTVATLPVIVEKLADRVRDDAMPLGKAEQALAFAVFTRAGHRGLYEKWTASRRRELLREHGLAVLDGDLVPVEVDTNAILEAALDRGVWGVG